MRRFLFVSVSCVAVGLMSASSAVAQFNQGGFGASTGNSGSQGTGFSNAGGMNASSMSASRGSSAFGSGATERHEQSWNVWQPVVGGRGKRHAG